MSSTSANDPSTIDSQSIDVKETEKENVTTNDIKANSAKCTNKGKSKEQLLRERREEIFRQHSLATIKDQKRPPLSATRNSTSSNVRKMDSSIEGISYKGTRNIFRSFRRSSHFFSLLPSLTIVLYSP